MKILNKNSAVIVLSALLALVGPGLAYASGPAAVNLGSAANFAILAKTGISSTGATSVTGDIGVSPAAASYITGFNLILPAAGANSTSAIVTGKVYAPDYAAPTPATLTTAVSDMATAYTDAAGRTNPTATELGAGNIGGLTLAPGLYKWGTSVSIPTDITLSGSANDVWIFQIAGTLTQSSATHITLAGGAQASNVFWVVAGQTTIGTTAVFNGNILDQTAIVLNTGAQLNGRALAQTAVTLDSSTVTVPTTSASVSTPTPTVTPTPTPVASTPSPIYTTTSTQTQSQSTTASQGQPITLGNGQIVYVSSTGAFTNANGQSVSATAVSSAAQVAAPAVSGQQIRTITANLSEGVRGNNVLTLQEFLIAQNKGSAARALANVGATGYFGPLTRAALAEFQAHTGISPALGNFGPITRAYMSANY